MSSYEEEPRVSPYLLRPARTYEEYLRDRAIAGRLKNQIEVDPAVSTTAKTRNSHARTHAPAWKSKTVSADQP